MRGGLRRRVGDHGGNVALGRLLVGELVVGGPRLDDVFSSGEWRATVFLSPSTGRVVVLGIDD